MKKEKEVQHSFKVDLSEKGITSQEIHPEERARLRYTITEVFSSTNTSKPKHVSASIYLTKDNKEMFLEEIGGNSSDEVKKEVESYIMTKILKQNGAELL